MKKIYFLASAMCAAIAGLAQTTITAIAVPQVGYTYNMVSDTNAADLPTFTVSAGSSSAQTWDYSLFFNNAYSESIAFQSPTGTPAASSFPSANLAFQNGTDWYYLIGSTNGLLIDGAYVTQMGTTAAADYTPDAVMFNTPSTLGYNSHVVSVATFTVLYSGQTFKVKRTADRTINADAFGSLTTPAATYPNTLRYKTYEVTDDSIFANLFGSWSLFQQINDTTTSYTWLQNSADARLMTIDLDATGATTKAQYLQSFYNGVAEIGHPSAALNVYPNPVSKVANVEYQVKSSGQVNIQLFDMNGRVIADLLNAYQASGKHALSINVESLHLPAGMYHLAISCEGVRQNLKLNVN